MDYKLHRISLRRGGSYIKSHKWLLHKRATINPKIKMMMNASDGQQFLHQIITKLWKKSLKTYLKNLNMKIKIFHHNKETGLNFEQNNEKMEKYKIYVRQRRLENVWTKW